MHAIPDGKVRGRMALLEPDAQRTYDGERLRKRSDYVKLGTALKSENHASPHREQTETVIQQHLVTTG